MDLAVLLRLLERPAHRQGAPCRAAGHRNLLPFRAACIPDPLFDTQIAAMVCGFGEAASYETLARKIAQAEIDKSARFTDWSRRPLTKRQLEYALADVTHLCVIYESAVARSSNEPTAPPGWRKKSRR